MIHRSVELAIGFVIVLICLAASPPGGQDKPAVAPAAERADPDQLQSNLRRLDQMSPEELVELRRKKRQFDELSPQQQAQVREFHEQLHSQSNFTELNSVMNRYYAWLRNLDRDERNDLLDLPADERLEQIKKLHEERARKLFGTTGATKLPSQDVKPFIEWINEFKKNRQAEFLEHFESDEGRQALQQWRERQRRTGRRFRGFSGRPNSQRGGDSTGSEQRDNEQRDNVRFNIFMEADPEFMAGLLHKDIESLLAKLSQEAIQILEEQNAKEQKLLVCNWASDWARQISSTRGMNDDELKRFYETLSEKEKETLDSYSPTGWRQRLEEIYRRQQRQRGFEPTGNLPDENRLDEPVPPGSANPAGNEP
jgi:hypothetical protein